MVGYDPEKRRLTLLHRGLDMAEAERVFEGPTLTIEDTRQDYGEARFMTVGLFETRMVVIVWTMRGDERRIISMRKANDREQETYGNRLA